MKLLETIIFKYFFRIWIIFIFVIFENTNFGIYIRTKFIIRGNTGSVENIPNFLDPYPPPLSNCIRAILIKNITKLVFRYDSNYWLRGMRGSQWELLSYFPSITIVRCYHICIFDIWSCFLRIHPHPISTKAEPNPWC